MAKKLMHTLLVTALFLSSVRQSSASVNDPAGSGSQSSIQSIAASTDPATASNPVNTSKVTGTPKHSSLAKKFLGVMTGVIVGTPVCMVRKPLDEDKYAVADLSGNSSKAKAVVPVAVFWAPFSCVGGILEAPFCAVNNSLINYDKPFSKAQFSLVKPGAAIKKEEQLPVPQPGDVR